MNRTGTKLAYNKSLDLLARREHSAFELEKKLMAKGFETDSVRKAIKKLQVNNLQSDARFCENFINSRLSRGQGELKIRTGLREHKIAENLIDEYLHQLDIDWQLKAYEVWQKKFGILPKNHKEKAKQVRFLQYRGFGMDNIKSILKLSI